VCRSEDFCTAGRPLSILQRSFPCARRRPAHAPQQTLSHGGGNRSSCANCGHSRRREVRLRAMLSALMLSALIFRGLSARVGGSAETRGSESASGMSRHPGSMIRRVRPWWLGEARQMSAIVQVFGRRQSRGSRRAPLTGVQKAPRHEVAGSWAPAGQRALWGFEVSADVDGGCNAARKRSGCVWTGEVGACNGHLGERSERISGRAAH